MQDKYIKINNLKVSENLSDFVNNELLKNTNVSKENFLLIICLMISSHYLEIDIMEKINRF